MAERPLYTLYKNLKAQNYDVPDDYNKFESALTRDGKGGADNRHAIYENLKAQNFDVPNTYERFYSALFEPRSKTSSRAKGGSVPMTAADRARFSAGAAAISASAQHTMNNAGRYNRLKQRKQKQKKDFGRVNLGTHQTPYGDANNVVKDDFAYNPETGKAGAYVTSDSENAYTQNDAEQRQNLLDKYGEEWNNAVDMGIVPSELDKADPDLSDTDVAMRQMERRQEWLNENQDRRSNELNESMHLQGSPFVASGGAVAPSSFNTAISNEANRLSDVEYGAYNTAKAYNQMLRTTLLQELKEQKQRNENAGWWKDKWNDVSNYFGAMFNTMLDPKLYSQGVMDAAIANNVLQVKKGMEDGTIKKGSNAGNAAQAMLGAIQQQQAEAAKQQQYGTKAYQYGDMSGRSLKFMGDFALSGWRNVMTTGFTKAGEKVGEKMALGALGKWFTKNTGRVLGDIAGSAALASTNQLGSTYNNVIERYVGMNNENGGVTQGKNGDLKFNEGVSLGKAIKDGFGSATIENFSEMFGEYLPGAPKLLSKLGLSKVSAFFEKIGNNAYYKWLSNATNKSGIQGVMAEISEEEFGTALHAAWGDGDGSWSDFNVFTNPDAREKQIDTCLGMFYSVGFMQAPRTAVGAINAVQYFNIKHQVAKADKFGQVMFNDKWEEIKSKIDVTTNADLTKTVLDATRSDSMTAKQKGAVINYAMFLSKLRGFNQAADAKTKDKVEEGDTAPTLSNDLDDAYTEGHNADDADKHDIQLEQNDKANELAAMLHITPEQLHDMADEDLEAMTGQDDKLNQAIYDYQVSTAKYQGVMDGAQDEVDMAAQQAAMETDNMTDLSRGTVRKATIKATGGLEDYEVYIISGNIATHDDGSIDVGNSDDMIIYYDPTTGRKEHADAMMFADFIEELPAAGVKAQAVADAKENAIKKIAGIVDGTIDVGSQFSVTDTDGTEHTYEVLADNGDGTAMITIDGNVPTELVKGENVQIPYSFADLQQLKDAEDLKRLETAKTQREQMEKERAAQQTEQTLPSFDFKEILNDNGNVVEADVIGKDGNSKFPNSKIFLIRNTGAKAKVVELKSDGTLKSHAVNKEDVQTATSMSLEEYKQARFGSSMIEDNSGENRGEIEAETPIIEDAEPIGTGAFGNIYNQFKGKVKEAFNFLMHHKSGDLLGVFHRDDVGDIDLVWGNEKMGLAHILGKHVGEGKDFETPDDAIAMIENVINSGRIFQDNQNRYTLMLDGVGVGIRKSFDGEKKNWIVTAVDFNRSQEEKGIVTNPTSTSHGVTESESAAALNDSDSKDINNSSNSNENNESLTFEDGTPIPVDANGETDLSQTDAAHAAEWYDNNLGEDADDWLDGEIKKAKKVLEQAKNKKLAGTKPSELVASKKEKEAAIADAQAHYDSVISIRDSLKERRIAKEENTPDGRKNLIEKARRKYNRLKSAVKNDAEAVSQLYKDIVGSLLHRLYDGTGIDVTDTIPLTAEEYVASNLGAHSLNYEGTETSKGVKQETGLSREDFAKTQLLAADGKGTTIDDLVHSLWENRPSNLESLDTQDIRNALIDVLTSGFKASEARNYIENLRIAQAENILEEQKKAADNAAFAEENKAESEQQTETAPESEEKTEVDSSDEINDEENEQTNAPELSNEQQKAMEEGEKLGFPAFDKEGEPINEYVVELAKWAKKQGLEIDPTSKLNSYADLFLMCKDGFGVITLVPDEGENINQVVYFPDNVKDFDQLWKLQEEFNAGRDLKHSSNIDSELTEGAIFYDADTAREFKEFVDKKVEEQNKVFGEQIPEEDLRFSSKGNDTQQTTIDSDADVEKNKVYDVKVVDNIVGKKTRKTLEEIAKIMGTNIQWLYSNKQFNGRFDEKTNTIYLTLDSSITEGVQFIFGHEMTHEMRTKNPAAYDELKTLVKDMMGEDIFSAETDRMQQRYKKGGARYWNNRNAIEEEVVADQLGVWIRDANYAHTLLLKMSHPLLARLHEIVNRFLMALHGIEISDDMNLILRSIEQAYVKTAKGEITNSETGEDVSYSLRQKPEPKKKGIGYKVFVLKDGKLYPPMVANPDGAATPVGVWLDADAAPIAGESKTGRPQVKQGGKGTQGGSGKLAYRPGWHLGVVPYAIQFNRKDAEGNKTLFPKNFVFAEVEYAADVDYQEEARQEGINPSGKYQHSLAGLKHLPTDGYYMYRTNPNPETDPWVITGAMKVNRILTRAEQAELVKNAGREPQQIQEGDIVTDDVVNSINQEIAAAPKFSLKDNQGNPLNQDGTLKLDKIKSVDELTDEDFLHPTRNVELPSLPKKIADAIGTEGKPVVIKKNIFERNYMRHKDVTPELSKVIFKSALYDPDLYGQNQKKTRPYNWVLINTKDEKGNNRTVLLEVNPNKDNVEIVHWHFIDERGLKKIKKQADREDGQLLILPSNKEEVGALSDPTVNLSAAKIDNSSETTKENGEKFSLKDEKIKSVAEKFGVNEDDVAMYANAVERGSTADAARARANIKRYLLQANEDKISSFKDIIKYTKPINEALKENFGDLDAMIEERRKQVEAQRNAMEAARKRAQEEEEKRQKHLEELSLIPTDELDKRYMDAIANNDESTAREMLDESARRNGYGDVGSDYQGQGAWAAPSNPQYESDEARRADIENSPDVNLEDIALGYNLQPDDYFDNPRAYMNNTAYGLESAHAIKNALDAIKNGEKDVNVKVYRAVPTSVKEGKLRNGDWVTPSKKYAEMHGDHRLEGKYRIIEDEVPANQLWWDGNDANEFGFDDGKEYRYKNAKNNRKLNDLITYDNKGNVIPPSKRFNSRKSDIRFSLAGERGAAAADKAEERTIRMDNLSVAKDMEKNKKKAKAIKAATGWERGADGKWRYEMPDAKIKDTMNVGGGHIVKRYEDDMLWNGGKLSEVIDAPELFKAYPQLKDVRIETDAIMNDMPSNGEYNSKTNTITIHADELKYMNGILNHEIQHAIQDIEGFAKGGSPRLIRGEVKKKLNEVTKQIRQLRAEGKEDEAKALVEKNRGLYNAYQKNDDYNSYKSLAGEVEARNVSARLNMTPEERRKSLAESTEDVARKDQIFLGVGDVSFSLRDMADGKESGAADMAEDLKSLNTPDEVDDAIKTAIEDMPSGWKMANKKMIHIAQALGENRKAEIAGEEPKFSLKDGTLIKAGTYFSGGGLVEEGLKGIIDPVLAVEYDEKISGVYRNNFGQHIVTADVRDVDPKELVKQIDGEVEYFHASPVCKNYSQAKSNHAEVELDKETAASTAEFINAVKPKVVTIENVKGYKDSDAMKTITDALDANGYTWDADVYNAADYGGYTNRERLIVRAVRDGKLPAKPKKMAHKSGWYEAVADIIPTLTEKKNGVANWMDIRLKADGIDWRNIDKPLYVMGSAYADGKIPHAFADELLPTLRTKSGDVIVMPDGKVYRALGRVLARVSGVSDDYKMPFSENLSHTIIGNGIPTQLTEHVIAPLLTGSDPKFSIRTYHGTGAFFDKFDLSHAFEGEGSETFGHGVYVTNSKEIGGEYAKRAKGKLYDKYRSTNKELRIPDRFKGNQTAINNAYQIEALVNKRGMSFDDAKKQVVENVWKFIASGEKYAEKQKQDGKDNTDTLDRLQEVKEALDLVKSLNVSDLNTIEPDINSYRYDVDIPDDNGSNYLDWEGTIPDSLDKQKVAEDAYKVVSDNQGFNDFKATPLNDFIAHTLKTYVNTTDVAGRVEKLKSDIKDVIENYVADDDVLALNEYLKDATPDDVLATIWYNDLVRDIKDADLGGDLYRKLSTYVGDNAASQILSDNGLVGIKYPAGMIHGGAIVGDYNYVIFDENNANIVGNTRFSLRYDQFEHDLNQWKKDNNLPKDAQRPTIPQRNAGESAAAFLKRVDEYRKQMALWKTAPTYEQHLLSDDTALGEFNRELQRGSVLKRIAFQDSMLAIRKAQEAIMKEVGVDRLNMAEDAYTAENRSHGKGKNEFEEYNNEFLQPLRKAYHQMKKVLGDSYDNVRVYMMAKHGLERDAQMAFKKSLEADYEDVNQRSAAYKAYKNDLDRVSNDADLEFGRVDFTTWRQKDNALRGKYSPSYMDYRYDDNGIACNYSGLSSLFDGSDFEEAAHKLVRDVETKHLAEVQALWNATNAATKKILRDGFKAGMMSKDVYEYVKGMYSHYIPLRGWDGTTADQVWDYIGGGKGAFNQTLKTAHGRTSIADDPIAYIENMAESGILLNNKNWVKQHLMLLAQNHPTSLLTLSKAWYVKSTDANGNEEWIPATPQITSQMNSNQVKAAIDAFEQKMEQLAQTGDATQQRDGLNIAYPQTHSEEREHEVRVMKDGEEYVIYVNGDPQLAQAMNNTRAHRVREIQSGKLDRAAAWLGRKMAAAYTSLSPLFIPSNYFRDLTMTLASTAIREDGRYNYLLRKNLATSWNLGFMLRDYQNGKLREKVSNGNATAKEQMFYDFMMNGGETGFVSSLDVEDLKKKFKNDLKDLDRWKANPVKVGHTIMDGIEFLNRAIEDSNRFAVYMTSIQYGRSIDEAVNDAKDVTLNFNRKGTGEYGWQMIRNLYLFINPAVQSLQTLGALAKHHPFKFTAVTAAWLASGVLVPVVNAALMSLLGGDDDKDKYWQFSKWDRRNNAIMWIPFTNEYVKIPLAQEFRAFYGVGDMIASKMMGGELAEETWSQYAEDMLGQVVDMLPLDPTGYDGNIAVSLMPNAIRPVFELAFNVDFTGKPLFKDTEYNKYDPNFTKAYVGTPDWLVRVSKMVNSIGNDYPDVQQNAIDAFGDPRYNLNNPAVVDHVLSSYLGGAYTMGSQVLGVLTKLLNDPKEIKMADIPLVSKFVSNPDDRPVTKKQGDEFWNMKENHDRAANTLSKLKKQAKVDGDYSMLERFYGSEEYKQYKQDDVKVKKYEEDKKKERAEESGEEYRPHKLNAEDIYKAHATPQDDFEDLKLKQLFTKLNGFKTSYDLLVDTAPSQSEGYYNTNKAAIDAIDEISLDKQEISELKKGFLDDGKDAYNAEDMKRIRELRKRILSVLELANKMVVANQKAKAEKK